MKRYRNYLLTKYSKLRKEEHDQEERYYVNNQNFFQQHCNFLFIPRRRTLEAKMVAMNLAEREKEHVREDFLKAEDDAKRDLKKKLVIDDFESLSIIGRFEIFIITHSNIKSFVLQSLYDKVEHSAKSV